MAVDFRLCPGAARGPDRLPAGYVWVPWHTCLTDVHGRVKYLSFRDSYDAQIFSSFRRFEGCVNLMRSIASHPGFVAQGTWMIAHVVGDEPVIVNEFGEYQLRTRKPDSEPLDYVATIQGIRTSPGVCGIQNIAVRPEFRGLGLGRALLMKGLQGFHRAGYFKVTLEATSGNIPALRLYETVGFQLFQTLYKEIYVQ